LPSTSQTFEPEAFPTKNGDEPTEPNARTGLFTPPGMRFFAFMKSSRERFCFIRAPGIIEHAKGKRLKGQSPSPSALSLSPPA